MLKMLLSAKGIENKKLNKLGQNAVHTAVQTGNLSVVSLLLNNEMYCI